MSPQSSRLAARAAGTWLAMLAGMVGNGYLREFVLAPRLGARPAAALSAATGGGLLVGLAWVCLRGLPGLRPKQRAALSAGWVSATVACEFGFGRYAAGHSWEELIQNYNLAEGRWWPLVLAALGAAPLALPAGRRRAPAR